MGWGWEKKTYVGCRYPEARLEKPMLAVQEIGVSRNNGGPIKGPLKAFRHVEPLYQT